MQGIQAELLTETTELHFQRMLTNPDYGYQEKHNGHRLMIAKQDGQLFWFNREGEKSSKALPIQVRHALLSHPLDTFVIDGELVKTTFFVFDALILGDEVITNDVYEYREARYHQEFEPHHGQDCPYRCGEESPVGAGTGREGRGHRLEESTEVLSYW